MHSFLEILEDRIAPATLVDAHTVNYTDDNGDLVQVKVSKGTLSLSLFDFTGATDSPQTLNSINLANPEFNGSNVSILIKTAAGNGSTKVGAIFANGNDLGKVTVQGDLVQIIAGNNITPQSGVASLDVKSLGVLDPASFGPDIDRTSAIQGKLGLLKVTNDVSGELLVSGGAKAGIGAIQIGGSLIAGAGSKTGWIGATGSIGTVTVGGDVDGRLADSIREAGIVSSQSIGNVTVNGSIIAGAFDNTGIIQAFQSIGNVKVGGNVGQDITNTVIAAINGGTLIAEHGKIGNLVIAGTLNGGAGDFSGYVRAEDGIGAISVGALKGGDGDNSGAIYTFAAIKSINVVNSITGGGGIKSGSATAIGNIGAVTVGGGLVGGTGDHSGGIFTDGSLGAVVVKGNLSGNSALNSGSIYAGENIAKILVGGSLSGGSGNFSGAIITANGSLGGVTVGSATAPASLIGNDGDGSASIFALDGIASIKVFGDVTGGGGDHSGSITTNGKIGPVSISGSLSGNDGAFSGALVGQRGLATVAIGGSLNGGTGDDSGTIQAGAQTPTGYILPGNISTVKIGLDVTGNDGMRSGTVIAWNGNMKEATIGRDVIGGEGTFSALVYAYNNFTKAFVGRDVKGGGGEYSGRIATDAGPISQITIGGNLQGGTDQNSGTLYAGSSIKSITIKGSVIGGSFSDSGNISSNAAIDKILIFGNLEGGSAENTGTLYAGSAIKSVVIKGSVIGGDYSNTGTIIGNTNLGSVSIGQNLIGGDNANGDTERTGAILSGKIGTVIVAGYIQSGTKVNAADDFVDSGAIRSITTIGKVAVTGDLIGNDTMPVRISGQVMYGAINANLVIGSVSVTGNVTHAEILAGITVQYTGATPVWKWTNPWAQIGSITVGGDWTASSISAGAKPGANGYGAGDTQSPNELNPDIPSYHFSKIGSLRINGTISDGGTGDQYGFVAANFGKIVLGGVTVASPANGGSYQIPDSGAVPVTIHRLPL